MASIFQSFPQPQPQPQQTQQQNTAKKQSGLDISFLNLIYNTPQLFNNNMTTTTTMIGTSQDDDATVPTQEVVHLNYSERQPQNNFFSGQTITVTDNSGNVPRYSTSSTGSFSSLFNNSLGGGNSASPGTSGNNNNVWDNAGLNNALFSSLAANLSNNNNNNNKDFDGSDNLLLNLANNELRTPTDVGSFSDIADLLSMTRGSEDDIVPDLDLMGLSQIGDNFRFPDLLGAPEGGKLKQELEAAKSRVMELENSLKKIHTTTTTTTPAGNNNSGLFNGPSLKVEDIPLLSPNSAAAAAAAAAILSNPALANSSLAAQLAALAPLAGLNFFNNNSSSSMLDVNNNNNSNPLNLFQSQQQHHHQQQQQQQQQQQAQPAPNNRTTPSPTMNNSADGSNNNSSSSFADNLSENAIIFPDRIQIGKLTIGKYTKKEREARIERYKEKRRNRCFVKKIRYQCRKKLADSRPRYKGRFCKEPPKPEQTTPELSNFSDDDDNNSNSGDCSNLIIPTMAHLSTSPSPAAESGSAPAEINNSNSNSNQQKSDQKRKKQAPAGTTTTTTTDNIKSNIKLPTKP